ncbi:MAG: Uma2 family endonuclease [Planctomycetes bacterium]|nr:Uma2 family endonuclease [Planctomycetota bacterium]
MMGSFEIPPPSPGSPSKNPEPALLTVPVDPSLVPEVAELKERTKNLPETDGEPLESPWHLAAITLLLDLLTYFWRERQDFFVGGNMFLYYSIHHLLSEDFKGPDFFVVNGVDRRRPRKSWIVWEENGKYPDLIVEFLSPTIAGKDRTTKKTLYERTFHTPEYFCFDPETNRLEGWRLQGGAYQDLADDERGWMWSEVLQLWLGTWTGEYQGQQATWLRFYDTAGQLIPLRAEAAEAEVTRLKARLAELEAERSERKEEGPKS